MKNNNINKLLPFYHSGLVEAGCDEAGRGCLAGSVFAAAVVLPENYSHPKLNDSKQLTHKQRLEIREDIIKDAVAWAIGIVEPHEIDEINILNASFLAMHRAIDKLKVKPQALIIDGNRFNSYHNIKYKTIVKGDSKYLSIAAASVLAKTFRDDYMCDMHLKYPQYNWKKNKGYPTKEHRLAIKQFGETPLHRKSFNLIGEEQQLYLNF